MEQQTIVNSWNEWDPLRHVIVGVATKGCIPVSEPAIEYHFPKEGGIEGKSGYWPEELVGRNCRFLQGPETDRETVADVRRAIAERKEIATEILNYRKNGSTFWNALFISPVYDQKGELVYFFGSQLDVSRRRDAEEALRQSQKMEAVGQLTGGVAHDFNNLLMVVSGHIQTLKKKAEGIPRRRARRRRSRSRRSAARP